MGRNKFIEQYKEKYSIYSDYVEVLQYILKKSLKKHKIHFQVVQGRTKSIDSLKKNLWGDKYKKKKIKSIEEIVDLAACRVVFYLEEDLEKFKSVLFQEFKEHDRKNKWSEDNYNAYHFIGTLKANRTKFSEYEEFKNILFEIQLTTVLFHGWNELEHDLFYKYKAELKKHYPNKFAKLQNLAKKIMKDYLRPAQRQWAYICDQYKLASEGKEIFVTELLNNLDAVDDNNKIYQDIEKFVHITKEVREIPKSKTDEVLLALKRILIKARSNKYKKEETFFGSINGRTYEDILNLIVTLLNYLKERDLKAVFALVVDLFSIQPPKAQEILSSFVGKSAEYNFHMLKRDGYFIQNFFVNEIKNWDLEKQKHLFPVIYAVAKAIFKPDFSHIESSYKEGKGGGLTDTFHRIVLNPSDVLKTLRKNLIQVL